MFNLSSDRKYIWLHEITIYTHVGHLNKSQETYRCWDDKTLHLNFWWKWLFWKKKKKLCIRLCKNVLPTELCYLTWAAMNVFSSPGHFTFWGYKVLSSHRRYADQNVVMIMIIHSLIDNLDDTSLSPHLLYWVLQSTYRVKLWQKTNMSRYLTMVYDTIQICLFFVDSVGSKVTYKQILPIRKFANNVKSI